MVRRVAGQVASVRRSDLGAIPAPVRTRPRMLGATQARKLIVLRQVWAPGPPLTGAAVTVNVALNLR